MAEGRPKIQIPSSIQLVGLPVPALLAWSLAGTLGHAIFLALTVGMVAVVTVVIDRAQSAAHRVGAYLTDDPGRSGDSAYRVAGGPVPPEEERLLLPPMRAVRVAEGLRELTDAANGRWWDARYTAHNLRSFETAAGGSSRLWAERLA